MKWTVLNLIAILFGSLLAAAPTYAQNTEHLKASQIAQDYQYFPALRLYEQTLNDRIENTDVFASIKDSDLPAQYSYEGQPILIMDTVLVPESDMVILDSNELAKANSSDAKKSSVKDPRFFVTKEGIKYIRFFVHPHSRAFFHESLKNYKLEHKFFATPLASFRSMIAWNPQRPEAPFVLKVSLDANIGHTRRLLSRSQIERATAVSIALKEIDTEAYAKEGILFIDEPLSFYLKGNQNGFTLREMPKLSNDTKLVPLFSLYARKNGKASMLSNMIQKSAMPPKQYIKKFLVEPMLRHSLKLAFEQGLIGEMHEQNVLAEVRNGQLTGRFYYRDLAGFAFNPGLRKAAGRNMNFIPKSFAPENMKFERANVMENTMDYVVNSNFFALTAGVRKEFPTVRNSWIEQESLSYLAQSINEITGTRKQSPQGLKDAIKDYIAKAEANGPKVRCGAAILEVN